MGFDFGFDFGFNDIFERFFGHRTGYDRSPRRQRGNDLRYDIEISLENAYAGLRTEINVPRAELCDDCNGTGAKTGTKTKKCTQCNGSGQMRLTRRTAFGTLTQIGTCTKCGGQGTIIEQPCSNCRGKGVVQKTRKIEIRIPKGVENGSQLRLTGQGEQLGRGMESGDLYIVIHTKEHPIFKRRNSDLFQKINIPFTKAALSGKIDIQTLEGTEKLKIPEGIESGEIIKINNKGMPRLNSRGYGDMYIEVHVKTPKRISKRAKRILEELDKELNNN
jgi:molecular chaperone DnaJ